MIARRALFILLVIPACLLHMAAVITGARFIWAANDRTVTFLNRLWWVRPPKANAP